MYIRKGFIFLSITPKKLHTQIYNVHTIYIMSILL